MISNDKYIPNLLHVILPLVLPDIFDNSHKRSKEFKLIEIFRNYLENQIPRTKLKSHQFDQIEIPFRYREKKKSKKKQRTLRSLRNQKKKGTINANYFLLQDYHKVPRMIDRFNEVGNFPANYILPLSDF